MDLPDFATDKHGYVLFDCPQCPRKAKLRGDAYTASLPNLGRATILRERMPNDCRAASCGFRFKPARG